MPRVTTKYGRSPWIDRFPKTRVPSYPRHRGRLETQVAIVGGGLTGCATAYAFAAAGVPVVLVEAGHIGRGASGSSCGWLADTPGPSYAPVEKALGRRRAKQAWQAWRRASLDFAALLRRLKVKCALEPAAALSVASSAAEEVTALRREQKARREAGLDAPLLNARAVGAEAALSSGAAIRTRDGAVLDPYGAALGLAAAAADRKAQLFEGSPAVRVTFHSKFAEVRTERGTIRAERVVVATGVPTPLFKPLVRHFWLRSSFHALTAPVPAQVRRALGRRASVVRDSGRPPHVLRWVDDAQLLISGADSDLVPARLREKTVVQRTGQLMYELSTMYPEISGLLPAYGWEAAYARTADWLPYIGPHRNYPRHLFALGDSSHSVTGAFLASRILLRYHLGEPDPGDEAFGFTR
jgi:glycine/D-amino acid oxidase-like deaminating enzyme